MTELEFLDALDELLGAVAGNDDVPTCATPGCATEATAAGHSLCASGPHPWLILCDRHRVEATTRWARASAWCAEHDAAIPRPGIEWRAL